MNLIMMLIILKSKSWHDNLDDFFVEDNVLFVD